MAALLHYPKLLNYLPANTCNFIFVSGLHEARGALSPGAPEQKPKRQIDIDDTKTPAETGNLSRSQTVLLTETLVGPINYFELKFSAGFGSMKPEELSPHRIDEMKISLRIKNVKCERAERLHSLRCPGAASLASTLTQAQAASI
jgi:hypothetical protein